MTPPSVSMVALSPLDLEALVERAVAKALRSRGVEEPVEYLDPREAAQLVGIHERSLIKLATTAAGFPGHRVGRLWRFKRSELLAWLEAQPKKRAKRGSR